MVTRCNYSICSITNVGIFISRGYVKIEPLNPPPAHICGRNAAWFIDSFIDTQVLSSPARVLFRDQMMCGQRRTYVLLHLTGN